MERVSFNTKPQHFQQRFELEYTIHFLGAKTVKKIMISGTIDIFLHHS
jgi:hypothetical protein